jgi:hypothetical protein
VESTYDLFISGESRNPQERFGDFILRVPVKR